MKLTVRRSGGDGFVQDAGFRLQHDGNTVTDRESQTVGTANQFGLLPVVFEAALAQGADEDVEKSGFHDRDSKTVCVGQDPLAWGAGPIFAKSESRAYALG
jgi:hypothetical protein